MSNETFPRLIWLGLLKGVESPWFYSRPRKGLFCYVRIDSEGQELADLLRRYIDDNKKLRAAAESDHHEHEKMLAEHSKLIKRTGELEKENEQLRIDKDSLGARISRLQATQKGHLYGPSVRKG